MTLPDKTYNGHRMALRVGVDRERLAGVVRLMRISGAVVGILLIVGSLVGASMNGGFEWTSYNETRQSRTGLTYPALGVVFGLVFLIGPIGTGFAILRSAAGQLYLNGTELRIVSPGNREPEVFDLTRTRALVRLDARTGSNTGGAKASGAVGAYRPVLVLLRESDNREFVVELANPQTRQMRSDQEILLFEGAMRFAADPATQRAAGQLRTVARWTKLPVIHETAPDAIPASPPDAMSAPLPPTPVTRGVAAPEIEIVGPNPV